MAKKGAKYKCETCGVVMVVDKACGCTPRDLICCGAPMKEVKAKPKAKPKAKKRHTPAARQNQYGLFR